MRGIAILAILFVNINGMGGSSHSGKIPESLGWTATEHGVWGIRQVLVSGTARGLLEMLFGAGMILLPQSLARRASGVSVIRQVRIRYLLLFLLGLVHIFVLSWYGDFLHIYALTALVVFPIARLPAPQLLLIGSLYAISLGGAAFLATGSDGGGARIVRVVPSASDGVRMEAVASKSTASMLADMRGEKAAILFEDRERTSTFAR